MTIPPTATQVYWPTAQTGYPFEPNKRYDLHRDDDGVRIYIRHSFLDREQLVLTNGEVTPEVLAAACWE